MAYSPFPPAYVAPGAAVPGNCIVVAGTDGTDARSLLVSTTGQLHTIIDSSASIAVTGTFYPATQPVSGTVAVTNAGLTALTFDGSSHLEVNVQAMPTVAVTGTFYQATQPVSGTVAVTNAGLTALASSIQAPGSAIPADVVMAGGSDGTDSRALLTDASGRLVIQQPNNVLLATTAESVTTAVQTVTVTAGATGRCVVVTANWIGAAQMAGNCCVRVRNTTTGMITGWQSTGLLFNGTNVATTLYFNLPVTSGDSIAIDYTGPTALTASKMNLAAVLSPLQIATTLRGDGRGMPLNSQVASGSLTATGAVTIAAPGAGFRLMLGAYSLSALVGASVVQLSVQTTKNGAAGQTVVLTDGVNGLSNLAGIFPIGEMSDPNTSASANITSTTGVVTATGVILYDVVPI